MHSVSWSCPSNWPWFVWGMGMLALLLALLLWRRVRTNRLARSRVEKAARETAVTALQESMLQSAQGLMLRFEGIARRLPADHPTRRDLIEALDRAERMLEMGLDKAQHLRDQREPPKDPGTHRHS